MVETVNDVHTDRFEQLYFVYLVTEESNAYHLFGVGEAYVYGVAFDAELTSAKFGIVAHILRLHELFEQRIEGNSLAASH